MMGREYMCKVMAKTHQLSFLMDKETKKQEEGNTLSSHKVLPWDLKWKNREKTKLPLSLSLSQWKLWLKNGAEQAK